MFVDDFEQMFDVMFQHFVVLSKLFFLTMTADLCVFSMLESDNGTNQDQDHFHILTHFGF